MDWMQFWGTAILTSVGLNLVISGQWLGVALIAVGVWYGPIQKEFWIGSDDD